VIECSNYVCGGNYSGFKSLEHLPHGGWTDIGYPIAEISSNGSVVITKQMHSGGAVTVDTCTSQLLYEIQGPWYFNSDVTAVLNEISFEQLSSNRVALHGVCSLPPPPTTKVGLTARGGFQA
jgi:Acyclic terpene utilisation family protein AtuA